MSENALKLNDTAYISISWYTPPADGSTAARSLFSKFFIFIFFALALWYIEGLRKFGKSADVF